MTGTFFMKFLHTFRILITESDSNCIVMIQMVRKAWVSGVSKDWKLIPLSTSIWVNGETWPTPFWISIAGGVVVPDLGGGVAGGDGINDFGEAGGDVHLEEWLSAKSCVASLGDGPDAPELWKGPLVLGPWPEADLDALDLPGRREARPMELLLSSSSLSLLRSESEMAKEMWR